MTDRMPHDRMVQLAANGVTKIDLLGPRGATLVTTDELVAMACLLVASGSLPLPGNRIAPPNPNIPQSKD